MIRSRKIWQLSAGSCLLFVVIVLQMGTTRAAKGDYDIGSPILQDVWVSTAGSNESGNGTTRATAFRTLAGAWNSLPRGRLSGTGYRIRLMPGSYPGAYLEDRLGTAEFPILIEPADGAGTVTFTAPHGEQGELQFLHVAYVYLQDMVIDLPFAGDGFQCEGCDHLLLRRMTVRTVRPVDGQTETVKLNQSQHMYIEDSDFSGAGDNALDAVSVQYGHVLRTKIHNAHDWCAYFKGGSAYIRLEGNEFYDCGTGGFTSGQGTGLQFMVAPWLHYEAYGITFVNNLIHHVEGACMGVNGGYNIVYAFNTCFHTGERSHLLEVVFGGRSCDGEDAARCQPLLDLGGWANPNFSQALDIPNRHVYVLNNLFYNLTPYQSRWQQFDIRGSTTPPSGSHLPTPASGDDDLHIQGNLIWNGPVDHPLGVGGEACTAANPTCNPIQLRANNAINTVEPQLQSPAAGNYLPIAGSNLLNIHAVALPTLSWSDAPSRPAVPAGDSYITVPMDRAGRSRNGSTSIGAYLVPGSSGMAPRLWLPLQLR